MTTASNQSNSEAEQAVLGAIMLQGAIPPNATIEADDFGNMAHRNIFQAMTRIMDRGEQVDLIATMTELGSKLEQAGGAAYLSAMTSLPISARNVASYCRIVQNNADRRRFLNTLEAAKNRAESGLESPADIIADIVGGQDAEGRRHPKLPPAMADLVIKPDELTAARLTPTCIVKDYLFADVATISAPGGTGKTTLVLHELICIALGKPVHGLEVKKPGWALLVSAEDPREQLTARLREIMQAMDLTDSERQTVLGSVLIWDVSGEQMRLVRSEDGNIELTRLADDIVCRYQENPPVMVIFDPVISFGASEGQVNDNEQAIITAARRIVRGLGCCVRLICHTGKANAREKTLDQYSSRGGSALSDGARMVAVLQTWGPGDGLKPPPGCTPSDGSSIAILARPKLSYAQPNLGNLWIRRTGHTFETFTDIQISQEERDEAILDQVEQFLASEVQQGHRHNKTSLERSSIPNLTRDQQRKAISILMAYGRIIEVDLPPDEVRTKRKTYLTTPAEFRRIKKSDDFNSAEKNPEINPAAYRENNGGFYFPLSFSPFPNAAATPRQDSAGLAELE